MRATLAVLLKQFISKHKRSCEKKIIFIMFFFKYIKFLLGANGSPYKTATPELIRQSRWKEPIGT